MSHAPNFKRMADYSDAEIESAIDEAQQVLTTDVFWATCRGIDAYFEKRRRRDAATRKPTQISGE